MGILALAVEKPYWQDVLVAAKLDITAVCIHYRDVPGYNKFFENFNGALVDGKKFYRLQDLSAEFTPDYLALDKSTLESLAAAERDYYILSDRFNYFPKPFNYRKRLWRESLRYWLAFYAKHNITGVFLGCTPHNLADYTGYHVAKFLKIPTVIIAHTMINDRVLLREDYRIGETIPAGFTKDEIPQDLYDAAMGDSKVLNYVIAKNDAATGAKNVEAKQDEKNYKAIAKLASKLIAKPIRFKGALAIDAIYSPTLRRLIKLYDTKRQYKLQKLHDNLAVEPLLAEKYIYFAMHMQPERTSTPEAGVFEDHLLAINILAAALPVGWKIFVKENPRQFNKINLLKGRHMRDISDYDDFLKNPNIKLISQKIPSKKLLENAQAISTLSGSVGWEALKAGKPCIIFANSWYVACESAYLVQNIEQARLAIAECTKSTPEQVRENILCYLSFIQNHLSIGNMGQNSYLKSASLPYDRLVNELAARISKEFA